MKQERISPRFSHIEEDFMTYIILGCPRSGTNLLSSIVKTLSGSRLAVEPFSMHVEWVLRDDLVHTKEAMRALRCNCGICSICSIKYLCRSGHLNFKETALFEYLPTLKEEFLVDRVLFIHRKPQDVVESYKKRSLPQKWRIAERTDFIQFRARHRGEEESMMEEYINDCIARKHALWNRHKFDFQHLELSYEDLIYAPREKIKEIAEFLHLKTSSLTENLIPMKFDGGLITYDYGTTRHRIAAYKPSNGI